MYCIYVHCTDTSYCVCMCVSMSACVCMCVHVRVCVRECPCKFMRGRVYNSNKHNSFQQLCTLELYREFITS